MIEEAKRQAVIAEEAKRRGLPEWHHEMANAVPDSLIRSIVADSRRGPPQRSSPAPAKAGSGWVEPQALGPRPASEVALVDRLVERYAGGPNKIR
jgi:hypothetical protein